MTADADFTRTISHLEHSLNVAKLTPAQKDRGGALLNRLTSAVRLTLLGLPGCGKTELVNLLIGKKLMPAIPDTPTTELVWGAEPRCRVIRSDGSEDQPGWPVSDDYDWSDAVFVKVEYPHAILQKLSFLEIVTDGSPEDLSNALNWAIPRTDIALWCTQEFTRLENALWVQVPDVLKDHGYLVITRADELAASGVLPAAIKRLSGVAADEFQKLFAVSTPHYIAAMDSDGKVASAIAKATGGGAIVDEVMNHVNRGRQADLDGADVFLARFGTAEVPDANTATETPVEKIDRPISKPAPIQAAQPVVDVSPKSVPKTQAPVNPDVSVIKPALDFIHEKGAELAALAGDSEDLADEVLTLCADTVDHIVCLFGDSGAKATPLTEEFEEAYETLVLMQLEQGDSSAADAATVVLQLTRELEMAEAA